MAMQPASPLVHVQTQPSLVISHLHMPIIRLQLHTIMPFIMQVHEHMLPASIVNRFCIMARATASSHVQVIFIPPASSPSSSCSGGPSSCSAPWEWRAPASALTPSQAWPCPSLFAPSSLFPSYSLLHG